MPFHLCPLVLVLSVVTAEKGLAPSQPAYTHRGTLPLKWKQSRKLQKEREKGSGEAFCLGATCLPQNAAPLPLHLRRQQPATRPHAPAKCCTDTHRQTAG